MAATVSFPSVLLGDGAQLGISEERAPPPPYDRHDRFFKAMMLSNAHKLNGSCYHHLNANQRKISRI